MTAPLHVAMSYPARLSAEYDWTHNATWLRFYGSDGSRLEVLLSHEQAQALVGLRPSDPVATARDLYVAGHIDVDEFELRLDGNFSAHR